MDKDKLNEAALEYSEDFANGTYKPTVFDVLSAFKDGTNWLMQQPLADRLTDEEKEKHKATYNRLVALQKEALKDHDDFTINITAAQLGTFAQIFGKELFNEK